MNRIVDHGPKVEIVVEVDQLVVVLGMMPIPRIQVPVDRSRCLIIQKPAVLLEDALIDFQTLNFSSSFSEIISKL